jgi:hypothetical protein
MKMKAEIKLLRGSNRQLDQTISELKDKLCIAPADSHEHD